jgi:hypothetical protein
LIICVASLILGASIAIDPDVKACITQQDGYGGMEFGQPFQTLLLSFLCLSESLGKLIGCRSEA